MTIHRFVGGVLAGILLAVVVLMGGLHTVTAQTGEVSLWPSTAPSTAVTSDSSVELGVKFKSDVAGQVTGLRYYRKSGMTSATAGSLWSSAGTLLARVTFSGTSTGWKVARFTTPVTIAANTVYVASYHAPSGYVGTNDYFNSGRDLAPLHAPSSASSGGNGVYRYGSSLAFPTQTWHASNYWIDVLFVPGSAPPPPCTFSVTPTTLNAAVGGTASSVDVTASASTCAWTATAGAAWLSVSPSSGTGSGPVTVTSVANPGTSRASTVNLAGQTVNVTQAGTPTGPGPLVVTCPANQTATSPNGGPVSVTWPPPTTTGGTAPVNVTANPTSGTLFSVGATNVSVSAASSDGQTATCQLSVTVTSPPSGNTITVGPGDCSATAVNTAIGQSVDGGTVRLTCTGTVAWTTTVSLPATKGITLIVQGATNTPKTAATFPLIVTSSLSTPTVSIAVGPTNAVSRVSGFKFRNSGTAGESGFINITGRGQGKFRVDNNYFDAVSAAILIDIDPQDGALYGVIDSNTLHDVWRANNVDYGPYGIHVANWWHNGNSCWGQDGWTNPFAFGDANWVFIEDNQFENVTPGRYMRHYIAAEGGGRYVSRFNTFVDNVASPNDHNQTDLMEGHGLCICQSTGCGTRGAEVYGNTIGGTQIGRPIMPRGGQWLIYDNTFTNIGSWGSPIWFMEYRAGDSGMYGQCGGSCPCAAPLGFTWRSSVTSGSDYPLPQQISGTYVWNNVFNGVNQAPRVDDRGVQQSYIQAGRDYFVSTSKPAALSSYNPYSYPHPIRTP